MAAVSNEPPSVLCFEGTMNSFPKEYVEYLKSLGIESKPVNSTGNTCQARTCDTEPVLSSPEQPTFYVCV